jgi:hypothetical protein
MVYWIALKENSVQLELNAPGERRPTGTEPRMSTEPALWAVRSTGWLGTVTENAPIMAILPNPSRN